MAVGDIPTAYGLSPWISLLVGSAVIIAGVLWLGKRSDASPAVLAATAAEPPVPGADGAV